MVCFKQFYIFLFVKSKQKWMSSWEMTEFSIVSITKAFESNLNYNTRKLYKKIHP